MIGGLFTSFVMELLVYPAVYLLWKWHAEVKNASRAAEVAPIEHEALGG
jgi:Cu(I)/Ag(I) efflux system membrane protein CusA/SilA